MTGTATRPRVLMEWRFMYLLPDWFAATPGRAAASRRNRVLAITAGQLPRMNTRSASIHPSNLIHRALRTHFRQAQNSGRRSRTGNSTSWQSSAFQFAGRICMAVPSVVVASFIGVSSCSGGEPPGGSGVECVDCGQACRHRPHNAYTAIPVAPAWSPCSRESIRAGSCSAGSGMLLPQKRTFKDCQN